MAKSKTRDQRIFEEACNGFGFTEMERTPEGLYCVGCMTVHKRPTKMYTLGEHGHSLGKCLCRFQVIQLFNPEDQ